MKYSVLVFLVLSCQVQAQKNPGPRSISMGSGGIALQGPWSVQQNPAGITSVKNPILALAYEQHLLDPDLNTQSAVFILPYKRSVFGFSFERYGIDEYKEQQAGLNYARGFGESFRLAIGFKYYQLSIPQYGAANGFSVEAGFQFTVTDKFAIASHIANPGRGKYENLSGSSLPVKLTFGASYSFSDRILIIADVRKFLDYPIDVMTGLEYNILKWFSLRGGISANPFKQYTGFGLHYQQVHIDVAVSSHPNLGYTPQIALGYEF